MKRTVKNNHPDYTCLWNDDTVENQEDCTCYMCKLLAECYEDNPPYKTLFLRAHVAAVTRDVPFPSKELLEENDTPFDPATYSFESPDPEEFVTKNLSRRGFLKPDAHFALFWLVTGGRICGDRNRKLYILWTKEPITADNIELLQNPANNRLWKTLPKDKALVVYKQITETIQKVFDVYLTRLEKRVKEKQCPYEKVRFENFLDMPGVKTFKKDVTADPIHNEYVWEYYNPPNRLKKKGKRVIIPCIHKMATMYHKWLPNFRRKRLPRKSASTI